MKRLAIYLLIVISVLMLNACGSGAAAESSGQTPGIGREVDMEEGGDIQVQDEMLGELVSGSSRFAVDLYGKLRTQEGNLFYSPASISTAMSMAYAGARGETGEQMAEGMHFTLSQEELHPAVSALMKDLASRDGEAEGERFRLHMVNALWGQEGYAFQQPFLNRMNRYYDAGLREVNYAADVETARRTINAWVAEQTEDRIEGLIPEGVLNDLTQLVLTNAVYFNAAWAQPFDEEMTADGAFTLRDGTEVSVPMMQQAADFRYAEMNGFQAVELPYRGGDFSMLVLLPEHGEFGEFEEGFSLDTIDDTLSELRVKNLALRMPVFETSSAFDLSKPLGSLGIVDAFTMDADFSGMDGTTELFISAVLHKAFVSVDEAGTEAAAATAVVMQLKAVMQPPVEVSVDRPFVFLIRDNQSGTILFMGRILDPTG